MKKAYVKWGFAVAAAALLMVAFQNCGKSGFAKLQNFSQQSSMSAETLSAVVGWNASTSANITGYRIYVGASPGVYARVESIANSTALEYELHGLDPNRRSYAVVRAVNSMGVESPASNEIMIETP